MNVYIICPVRFSNKEQDEMVLNYVHKLESEKHIVFYPKRDAKQDSETGIEIVDEELKKIKEADEVHVFWDINSKGSHFDLGATLALGKKIKVIHTFEPDIDGKSYYKVMKIKER